MTEIQTHTKAFKVVTRSENTNSFGLRGLIVMARDGEAWEIAGGSLYDKKIGEQINALITITKEHGNTTIDTSFRGYEIPRRLPMPPQAVINEVWGAK